MKKRFENIKKKVIDELNAKYGSFKNLDNWAIIEEGIDSVLIYFQILEENNKLSFLKGRKGVTK